MASLAADPGRADGFMPAWMEGACICLFGSTLSALGLVLQKFAHSKCSAASAISALCEDDGRGRGQDRGGSVAVAAATGCSATCPAACPADCPATAAAASPAVATAHRAAPRPAAYFLQPWWLLGFGIFLAAQVINMVSMAMTPQLILSCLGSWTLVCNTMFAHLLLGERICREQALAVAALVASTALVLYTAPRPPPGEEQRDGNLEALSERVVRPAFDALTFVLLSLATMACAGLRCARWRIRPATAAPVCAASIATFAAAAGNTSGIASGASAAAANAAVAATAAGTRCAALEAGEALQAEWRWTASLPQSSRSAWCFPGVPPLVASAWALVAAISTGYTVLCFKCIAELLAGVRTAPTSPLLQWEFYIILVVGLSLATFELHCLNLALRSGDAVKVVPMYLSLGMLAQMSTGGVFFQEFDDFRSAADATTFAGSVVATLVSVAAMVRAERAAAEACDVQVADAIAAADVASSAVSPAFGAAIPSDMAPGDPGVPSDRPMGAPVDSPDGGRAVLAPGTRPTKRSAQAGTPPPLTEALLPPDPGGQQAVEPRSASRGPCTPNAEVLPVSVSLAGFGGAIEGLDAWAASRRQRPCSPLAAGPVLSPGASASTWTRKLTPLASWECGGLSVSRQSQRELRPSVSL